MLVRAAGTGDWSQTASIRASTDTARLRLISSVASPARCLGAPSGTTASPALSCKGPRTPNWRLAFDIARQPFGSTWASAHILTLIGRRAVLRLRCGPYIPSRGSTRPTKIRPPPKKGNKKGGGTVLTSADVPTHHSVLG